MGDHMTRPRTLLVAGVGLFVLAAVFLLTLRVMYGERAAYVHVRWKPRVEAAARARVERAHALMPVEFKEQRTWLYLLTDVSRGNIRQLIADPAIEDTHYINRQRATIAWSADRGDYAASRPMWIAETLEFGIRIAGLAGAVAVLAGGYQWWKGRRRIIAATAH
jgi:hypothetical protein